MPIDKSGALLIVAGNPKSWMDTYRSLRRGGKITRHKELPKSPSKAFKFLAYSAGAPPGSRGIRKSSNIYPENMWHDGTHVRYQESDPRFLWVGGKRHVVEEDDDDDDDDDCYDYGCGHPPRSDCCEGCATPYLGWERSGPDYLYDGYANTYGGYGHTYPDYGYSYGDYGGHYPPPPPPPHLPCQEVSYSMPAASYPPPDDRRGRRFTRMASPPPGDDPDDKFIWREGEMGPVRYSSARTMPLCEDPWKRPSGVDRFRCV